MNCELDAMLKIKNDTFIIVSHMFVTDHLELCGLNTANVQIMFVHTLLDDF